MSMVIHKFPQTQKGEKSAAPEIKFCHVYSPLFRSKPIRLLFIFRTQMKIFFNEIWQFSDIPLTVHTTTTLKTQKINHVTTVVPSQFLCKI